MSLHVLHTMVLGVVVVKLTILVAYYECFIFNASVLDWGFWTVQFLSYDVAI
jgi:hypothetical protein